MPFDAQRPSGQPADEVEDVEQLDSPLDGNELMALFSRPPGRWIGTVKDYLLELVLDGELDCADKVTASSLATEFLFNADQPKKP